MVKVTKTRSSSRSVDTTVLPLRCRTFTQFAADFANIVLKSFIENAQRAQAIAAAIAAEGRRACEAEDYPGGVMHYQNKSFTLPVSGNRISQRQWDYSFLSREAFVAIHGEEAWKALSQTSTSAQTETTSA